jgi:hypothetical protein
MCMTRTITLRLSDRGRAHFDERLVEAVLDAEDMRRRCAAHGAWMEANPAIAGAALAFGEANQQALGAAGLPSLATGAAG